MHSSPNQAQEYFPRGLNQPEGSFRFSIDALLLSCFATAKPGQRLLDIGTGCGVIALGLLLRHAKLTAAGLDIEPLLLKSALENAQKLGLEQRFEVLEQNVEAVLRKMERQRGKKHPPLRPEPCPPLFDLTLQAESFDLAVCNPPYRRSNQGRPPQHPLRLQALFEHERQGRLEAFVATAAFALKNKAPFYCVYPSERLSAMLAALKEYKLEPKLLLPLQSRPDTDCALFLLKATKNGRPGLTLKKPLLLYESMKEEMGVQAFEQNQEANPPEKYLAKNCLTQEALNFCPWLSCNAER